MIDQDKLFFSLGFIKCSFEYKAHGRIECYKSPDNHFYKLDHFDNVYVIEHAECEQDAKLGIFEDAELFRDIDSEEVLYQQIFTWLTRYA